MLNIPGQSSKNSIQEYSRFCENIMNFQHKKTKMAVRPHCFPVLRLQPYSIILYLILTYWCINRDDQRRLNHLLPHGQKSSTNINNTIKVYKKIVNKVGLTSANLEFCQKIIWVPKIKSKKVFSTKNCMGQKFQVKKVVLEEMG